MRTAMALAIGAIIFLASAVDAREVTVKSYTKKDGTKVSGYTKTVKDTDTVKVDGYTKKDGTKVKSYTRKKTTKTKTN
jgi:hypothetical protein